MLGHLYLKGSKTTHFTYHEILLLQKFNDIWGKVLKPKKISLQTQKKKMRPVFGFSIVSDCMVYPDPKLNF